MEGDGEGLVAIVQGLENSGVTLTVCNRPRHSSDTSRPSGLNRIQINAVNGRSDMPAADQRRNMVPAVAALPAVSAPAAQRTSVETSTGSDFSRMATASQICDGRYASSYKLAHCMISPTSPPEAVTEFPPQRKEPCRNQGNFEIGGQSSGQWNGHAVGHNVSAHGCGPGRVQTSRVKHYGGTQTWGEKGSSHRYSKSNHRESEAFAHSLRKYPSMAPFRTASTDLIEKLIRYTQAKNYQEASRSTKSMRSLRYQRSSETYDSNKVSTQQQTYTRRRDENSNVQSGSRGRTRHFKLYSPISDNRHLRESRYRETTCSSSYDYLKAGSPTRGRANRSDGSPSPSRSRSPEMYRKSERSRSPHRIRSPDRSVSPCGSGLIRVERPSRAGRPLRFERSVRDLSLSEMSKYIRSTIRQICNERPVVVQVCPKLKDRYNQHRKVCPNKNESSRDVMEFEEEEDPADQASGSVLSRFVQSFSGRRVPSTEQTGCQCSRTDCYCTKATQCANNPTATTNTATCSCLTTNTGCCRGMPCVCASKSQDQAYYNKRIDEEISEWLRNVPVQSIEKSESKMKRETLVKELRNTLKQLPDDENFDKYATNEIQDFVEDFPLWNPGKDESDEKLFKNQLADVLAEKIKAIPRKPDRLRDIVRKWVENMDFEDNSEEVDMEAIIDNFVNRLKSLAADRPACDVKYTNLLKKDIIELLVELALKFDGDMAKLKKMAYNLATEVANIPRNVNISGETTKLASAFEENIADWICEHGLCEELKKDPKLIESLTKRLHILKAQGVLDEDIREEVKQFVDDVGLAFETTDELIEELMKQLSSSIQMKEAESIDQENLNDEISEWLRSLPGGSDLHLTKFGKITKDIAKAIQENREQENENLANDIVNYLLDTDLPIDPADLGVYVEELMENLGIQLSDRFRKEQAKRVMIKDIFDIIKCSPIPEEKKEQMRNKAHEIVENNLRNQSFYLRFPPDSVKETLLQNINDVVSDIDIPTKSRLQLKSLLNASINRNFDKSFTSLIRKRSDLKQSIINDVGNALDDLPIGPNKKSDLMQKVKETLSKNMNKPLPNNVKNNINDEICDVVERCPICEDRNILGRIKKILSEVASKHLTIYLPNCVCDIQSEVEEDVSAVIDKSSIDIGKKKDLKESIQDILTENEDRHISDEVIRTIKEDINNAVSDLSIPQDKKDVLKKAVGETVSQDFKDAGDAFSHDLNKIRNKLLDDINNIIEKSPIQRDVKSHLKDKLDTVLARNLDSSLSDERALMILDDISDIVRDVMPQEKRRTLTNKLAETLGTHQRKEETDELTEIINRLSIDSIVKDDMKKKIKSMLLKVLYNPLSVDVRQKISEDLLNAIDEMDIQEHEKKILKSNISQVMAKEFDKLTTQDKEVPEIKDAIEKIIKNEIKNTPISKDKQELLEKKMKDVLTENLNQVVTEEVKEMIQERLENIVDDLITDEDKADAIKIQLRKVDSADFVKSTQTRPGIQSKESLWEKKQKKYLNDLVNETRDNILPDMEQAVDEASIPREKKIELKNKLKNIAIKNFKKPLDDVEDGLKDDINVILDELNLPHDKKNKLNRELTAAVDKNMNDLQEVTKHVDTAYSDKQRRLSTNGKFKDIRKSIDELDETKVKDKIFQGVEKIVDESGVPEEKKLDLKRKIKKIAAETLEKPLSKDVQDTTKNDITEIINDLPIPENEKTKLKTAVTNIVYNNVANFREKKNKKVEDKPLHDIFQDTERAIEEAPISREKKTELKRKLKKLTTKDFNEIPIEHVPEAITDDMIEIIDELNLPKGKTNELKSALTTATDEYMSNMQKAARKKYTEYPEQPLRDMFQDTERAIEEAPISRDKKTELKKKLKKLSTKDFNEIPLENVPEELIDDMIEIIDELNLPKGKTNELKSALTTATDEYMSNMQKVARKKYTEYPEQPLRDMFQDTERAIEEAPISRDKKTELKKKLKKLSTKDFNEIPLENVPEELIDDVIEIIDELNLPKGKTNELKSALTTATDEYMSNMQKAARKKYTEYPEQPLRDMFQDTERAIEEAPISRDKKTELKKKLKKLSTKNFNEIPLENVSEELIDDMIEIIDELNLPKGKTNELKSALTTATDEYMSNMQKAARKKYTEYPEQPLRDMIQDTERAIEEAPISRDKKTELKKKLKKLSTKDFNEIPLENVPEELIDDMIEIIDELNLPKGKTNELKSALTTATDEYMSNMRTITRDKNTRYSDQKGTQGVDSRYKKISTGSKPTKVVDATKVKDTVLQGIEKIIEDSTVPKEKKVELQKKLKNVVAENMKKPHYEDVQDSTKNDITAIIKDLPIPNSEKNILKTALTNMVDDNMDNLRGATRKLSTQGKNFEKVEDKPLRDMFQDTERAIEEAPIPRDKKTELKKKLKKLTTKDFNNIPLENVPEELIDDMIKIIDELNLPKGKTNELKSALNTATDEYISNKLKASRNKHIEYPDQPLHDMFQDTERAIEEAPIPREKKTELKKKLKKLTAKDFNKISLDNVPEALIDDMPEIIEELNLPKEKKNKLKSALTTATDEYMSNMRTATKDKNTEYSNQKAKPGLDSRYKKNYTDHKPIEVVDAGKVKDNILRQIEKITDDSNVPKEKKTELKRKLKQKASENLKKPFSEDVEDSIKNDIGIIIDDLPIPRTERKKLKNALTNMVDENVNNLRGGTQKLTTQGDKFIKVDDKPLHNVFQETERAIEEAPLPREKKKELKTKLKKLTNKDFNKIPLDVVTEPPTDDMIKIIDELNLSKDKKNKLKNTLTTATDEYMSNMRTARNKYTDYSNQKGRPDVDSRQKKEYGGLNPIEVVDAAKVKDTILKGIEEITEDSNVPKEKKMELKRKLKNLASENLKKPLSEDVEDKIKIGINKIIDDLPIPKTERNKLKSALTSMVDDNMDNMRGATQKITTQEDKFIKVDDKPLHVIFQKTERAIEEAPLPREKKNELKKKLNKLTNKDFNKIPLEDVAEPPTDEMIEIIDELNLPKDKKNKLKNALTTATDEYKSNMKKATRDKYTNQKADLKPIEVVDAVKVKDTILQGIDKITEDSNVPKEKKMELKKKLQNIANENLKKPFSKDVEVTIKNDIAMIIDDQPIPKSERNKLKSALTNMVSDNVDILRGATQKFTTQEDKFMKVDDKPLHDIFQETERAIEEAPLPREKKNELKKKLNKLTNKDFNKVPLEDVVQPPTDEMIEIIDELNLPKDKKNKLKGALTTATDEYTNKMRTVARDTYTANRDEPLREIFKEIERAIEEAPIPREKKNELKMKLKKLTTKDFNKIPLKDVAEPPTDDMIEIIDEMNLPKDKKNKLKSALTTATDEYMSNMRTSARVKDTEQLDQPLRQIFKEIERAIEESPLSKEKKNELKKKLNKLTSKDYNKIPLEDVAKPPVDDMIEIIDELNLPKDKKNNLKNALTTATDEYMSNVRTAAKDKYNEYPDQPLHEIFQEMERAIEDSSLPREKKNELEKKLKKLTNKDYNKIPLEDVAKPPTDDMIEIIDELNLPKDKKNELKSALTTATDEYMTNVRAAARDKYNEYPDQPLREVFQDIERAIEEAPLPREKKIELKKKLKKLTNKDFNEFPLKDVTEPPTDDVIEIIDEINLPKDKKNKLKSALTAATDEYISNMRTAAKIKGTEHPDQPLREVFLEMEQAIEESPLPREKKNELKKKLKKLSNKDFNKIPLEDVVQPPTDEMIEIIDEMNLPKDKKNKLKGAVTTAVDEYTSNMQTDQRRRPGVSTKYKKPDTGLKPIETVDATKVKNNILQGIEKITEDSTLPKEKKTELKRKLKNIIAENLKKPFSKDMQDTIKNDIAEIIDKMPISKTEKKQLNNALTNMLDENIPRKMPIRDHLNETEDKPLHNIYKYMKRAIGEAPISKEKKTALKKKLQDLATKDFSNKSLEDVAEALKVDIIEIIDELNLPKDKKNNLKNVVVNMIDENITILQSESSEEPEDRTQRNILQGIEKVIDEAPIPREISTELKKELTDTANKNFKKPWSDDDAEALKDDINNIIEDTNLPKDKKNNLKNELTAVVNENMSQTKLKKPSRYQKKLAKSSAPRFVIDETDVKGSMKQEVKKSVQQSEIADADKSKLNLQLLKMISGMLTEFDEALDERIKKIFDKYGIEPSYQKTLLEEYNKLLEIILKGGDLEAARRKLIEKLMQDLNLSEEVATALVDELIALAREMAQEEGISIDDTDDILKAQESVIEEPPPSQMAPEYKEQSTSERRRKDQASSDTKGNAALSTGNINYSLKELIATNKSVRKQWSRHLDNAITKLPLLKKENNDLKNKLAIYDETGQINILSNLSTSKEETEPADNFKSNKQAAPKPLLKNNKGKIPPRLSKIEEAFTFNNTTKQKSPFTPNSNPNANVKDFTSNLKETINTWLKKAQVEIEPNEKNRILDELTKDIIDRQKYLQTFGEKPSQSDNLEYLKLQVHRRLNGLVPIEALKQMIGNTKELVVSIENVKIPQLVVSPPPTTTPTTPPAKTKNDQQKLNTKLQKPSSPAQRKLGPADILGIHSKATNTTTAGGVPHTVEDDDGVEDDLDTEFRPGQASTPAKPISFVDKVTDAVMTWLENMPIDMEPEMRMDVINDLVTDIVDRQKYLQVNPDKKFSEEDEIENLRFQVFKRLDKIFEPGSSVAPNLVKIEELYKMINGIKFN